MCAGPGQITVAGLGTFRTVGSRSGWAFDDYVTLANPAAVDFSGAIGATYTLGDDDIGGILGFPSAPIILPTLPDTSLMHGVYANAYLAVDVVTEEAFSQTNLTFSRNVLNQSQAYALIDGSKSMQSSPAYWAVHVVSAYQGYANRDGDHDNEEAGAGLLYGLTKVGGLFQGLRGGSLVFLETCRDYGRTQPTIGKLIRYNVAHEVGHQLKLEHGDDAESPPGSGTYFMMTAENSVFPNNLWFSANSLSKIRSRPFPQDD